MRIRSLFLLISTLALVLIVQGQAYAQATPKKIAPTAQSVKALIIANKTGGAALTQALISAIKADPKLIEVVIAAAEGAAPELLASISAAVSQAIVEIAQVSPKIAAELKSTVEAKAADVLKQQVAVNLVSAATATATATTTTTTAAATTGSAATPLGDVGVPLSVSTPSSSRSPT